MKKTILKFKEISYSVEMDSNSVALALYSAIPLKGEVKNIGGEIFFRTDNLDIPFDGSETKDFNIGDIVYWRSSKGEKKFAIAFFYGNTKFSDWETPRAASPCVKIGNIVSDVSSMVNIESGENALMKISNS